MILSCDTEVKKATKTLPYRMDREEFFKEHGISCTCRVGYVICQNCVDFYKPVNFFKYKHVMMKRWGNIIRRFLRR